MRILYNVTLNVEDEVLEDWMAWMKDEHIPEVMGTGLFLEYKMLRLINEEEDAKGTTTYAVQYYLKDLKDFLNYVEVFAPRFQQKTFARYGEKVLAFRTILEEIISSS